MEQVLVKIGRRNHSVKKTRHTGKVRDKFIFTASMCSCAYICTCVSHLKIVLDILFMNATEKYSNYKLINDVYIYICTYVFKHVCIFLFNMIIHKKYMYIRKRPAASNHILMISHFY